MHSNNQKTGVHLEALLLFIVLFFSGSAIIPAIAVICYILVKNWKTKQQILKPGKKDIIAFFITLPCLIIVGSIMGYISSLSGQEAQITFSSPSNALGWILFCFSVVCSAYLEESFFRFYLLSKRDEMNLTTPAALLLSTALFSVCHIYLGTWGFINSIIAGLVLGIIFLKFNSLHGIAIAHILYNIAAYLTMDAGIF